MERDVKVEYIDQERGRGVIANRSYTVGEVIEVCPVVTIFNGTKDTEDFEFAWGHKKVAIVGGMAHFYNHSDYPNVTFTRDMVRQRIIVVARTLIYIGEELCHHYACKPWWNKKPTLKVVKSNERPRNTSGVRSGSKQTKENVAAVSPLRRIQGRDVDEPRHAARLHRPTRKHRKGVPRKTS